MKKKVKRILSYVDYVLAPAVYLAAHLLRFVRWAGVQRMPLCKKMLQKVGVFPIRDHYYEPIFDSRHLVRPLSDIRNLKGIDWNIDGQLELLKSFSFAEELKSIPLKPTTKQKSKKPNFYINNGSFSFADAAYWYNLIRAKNPSRIIEIGSGNSTLLAALAITKNKHFNKSYSCKHICIEPYEVPWLEQIGVTVIREKVENVDVNIFSELKENDFLFIDSSHIIRPQGDVLFEYLELLPTLKTGVIVHVHDIFSPKDYPEEWIINEVKFWNEQYLLEAFLISNKDWKIIAALNFLHSNFYSELKKYCVYLSPECSPGSFYIQKVA